MGKPFEKGAGKDPRINRKGRPKSFDALRALTQQIAHEEAKANGQPIVIDGHTVTVTEAIMRQWAQSKDVRLVQAFIQYAYGKVPDVVKLETDHVKGYLNISPDDWDESKNSTNSTLPTT
jgi:hypothetical protein